MRIAVIGAEEQHGFLSMVGHLSQHNDVSFSDTNEKVVERVAKQQFF